MHIQRQPIRPSSHAVMGHATEQDTPVISIRTIMLWRASWPDTCAIAVKDGRVSASAVEKPSASQASA